MSAMTWVINTLDKSGGRYRETHHEPAFSALELAHAEHENGCRVLKTVAVNIDGRHVLLVLSANRKVRWEKVRDIAKAGEIRLLSEGEMTFYLSGCEVGATPPLRHWAGFELWMDRSLNRVKEVVFAGGNHVDAIRMSLKGWKRVAKPREESFSVSLDAPTEGYF